MEKEAGKKLDAGKVELHLLSPVAMEGTAKVLTFGKQKYGENNWRKGIVYSRILSAVKRHLLQFEMGLETDPQSGLGVLDHAAASLMFLQEFVKLGRHELDDRFFQESKGNAVAPAETWYDGCKNANVPKVSATATEVSSFQVRYSPNMGDHS